MGDRINLLKVASSIAVLLVVSSFLAGCSREPDDQFSTEEVDAALTARAPAAELFTKASESDSLTERDLRHIDRLLAQHVSTLYSQEFLDMIGVSPAGWDREDWVSAGLTQDLWNDLVRKVLVSGAGVELRLAHDELIRQAFAVHLANNGVQSRDWTFDELGLVAGILDRPWLNYRINTATKDDYGGLLDDLSERHPSRRWVPVLEAEIFEWAEDQGEILRDKNGNMVRKSENMDYPYEISSDGKTWRRPRFGSVAWGNDREAEIPVGGRLNDVGGEMAENWGVGGDYVEDQLDARSNTLETIEEIGVWAPQLVGS